MRYAMVLTAALAFSGGSARAQLAQPPGGVTEGIVKERMNPCAAKPQLAHLDAGLVGLGRSG